MDRKLIDYLPPVLREVADFQEINGANEPEILLAWEAMARVLANQFLDSADESGVRSWEQDAGIFPKDTDTLEIRKTRLKAKWGLQPPFTLTWLRNWVTSLCGGVGHREWIDDYDINLQMSYTMVKNANEIMREILALLTELRPSNMRLQFSAETESTGAIAVSACSESAQSVEIWPRLVHSLESDGKLVAAGALEYHAAIEIYPRVQEG